MKISKERIKYVSSLRLKKHRKEEGVFTAEGAKCVADTLDAFELKLLVACESWFDNNPIIDKLPQEKIFTASRAEMERMSSLSTAPEVIAVYNLPNMTADEWKYGIDNRLTLMLDGVQDPGNLGQIIRTADWFGVRHIAASPDTCDLFNAKTIQATMGAVSRVKMLYTDLGDLLSDYSDLPVYGTLLEGDDLYKAHLTKSGFIIMGNEGKGISPALRKRITAGLRIPSYPPGEPTSESLNVAAATAVTLAEFRRHNYGNK